MGDDAVELIRRAMVAYNRFMHSVTDQTLIDLIHVASYELRQAIKNKNVKAQRDNIERSNLYGLSRQ